ncbi:putative alpha-ketoglutarate-dependent dioxygenase ABH6-like protein [Piptocephalis cylindrospora]|uniref:Putative alpha-ketoglutarate-dependent dioxygenase ABH6-like protein n=1 Tax=Piptocephalis cylindrospora TaxID=1907219 RepID=A0A4P9Y731_9FUNG|nr:putative alpha-ketoglutarate-dependent dioxygenase ABH6-like protein [Piptocephalis cylindrospora]|eukprot:RKP14803.1 putative alpha-ketoglutarate-dependent dioxygenase ABH6-like protein [Piptocephalis cylindrospora]
MPSSPLKSPLEPYALTHPTLPKGLYYIPDFITEDEEAQLARKVTEAPRSKWVTLSRRRLQTYGGTPHAKGTILEPLPSWTQVPFDRFRALGIFTKVSYHPNHLLVNEYLAGQGIMPHEDGPYYLPTVATITLGSYTVLDLYPPNPTFPEKGPAASILLERCSLVILSGEAYTAWRHGIAERSSDDRVIGTAKDDLDRWVDPSTLPSSPTRDFSQILSRGTRISLTYRQVAKPIRIPRALLR